MKSPWKLLGQLISRRDSQSPDDAAAQETAEAMPATAGNSAPASAPSLPDLPSAKSRDNHEAEPPEAEAPAREEPDPSQSSVVETSGEKQTVAVPPQRRRSPIRKTAAPATPETTVPVPGKPRRQKAAPKRTLDGLSGSAERLREVDEHARPARDENPFIAEVVALDGDIRQLRQQLAEKLRRQNEQLKAMHARFERD
jgi:hypothetical protein